MAELQHYVQRETDALVLAEDVAKQLEGISSLDHMAAAEVEPVPAPSRPGSGDHFSLFHPQPPEGKLKFQLTAAHFM